MRIIWVIGWLVLGVGWIGSSALAQDKIVVLLSSEQQISEQANAQLLTGIRRMLPHSYQLQSVYRDDFSSLKAAWQAVMQLQPQLVIGPLYKQDVRDVIALAPTVPVIALNQVSVSHPNVWQFSLSANQLAEQLANYLSQKDMTRLLVLSHYSPMANQLQLAFRQQSTAKVVDTLLYRQPSELLSALYAITRLNTSRSRIEQLQALIDQPIAAAPWLRQDVDAMVLFLPLADALEVSHQIDYLWNEALNVFWVDTGANALSDYVRSTLSWGRMKALMPNFYVQAMQQHRSKEDDWFTALGEDAMRLAIERLANTHIQWPMNGSLGQLTLDDQQYIRVHWPLVWLGDGHVDYADHMLESN